MTNQVRCAVLGLGRLGYYHARNIINEVHGAKLVSVCDPMKGRAEQVAEEFGLEKWTDNPDVILEDPNIDAVIIVTPTSTHAEMIKKAAEHGKQIFVEKPLTLSLEESKEVIEKVKETSVICQVGFMRRFDPAYADAKRRIDAGEIGKPIYFKGFTRDSGSPPPEFIKHSGGIFIDCSIHDYDIARYVMGAEITSVSGHGRILNNPFMEEYGDVDQALTYLEFDSGAAGDVEASRTSPYGHDIRAEIIGTEGSIFVGTLRNQNVTILTSAGSNYEIIPDFQTRFHEAYCLELQHFAECVQTGKRPLVTEVDATINLEIGIAATDSYKTGKPVKIHMDKIHADV
ncbi:inositol 2-dehydrogenase [Bacillus atrophaeus]|uniref:inositol 2-dehydrogenase n=1 Tax=Bacillus atrophaeus TaxID=1452 RepID=UPI00227EFDA0|nr:inositol 2-dehydrogenase [Bacillus atrophaeus]MCY8911845.1 inositol 2-dehydrogenase [Bacillus atrophaeus]MCY9115363.1 inositol 2-dehydrogenase [Bacillus atrophaeus]MEC0924860.1 inositol 2-dehydrogenase [Bacillus atrophaeus]MEC0933475.1 inositol 2-dehydrogenase [Bacillus atrophaeus]